MRTNVYVDGFNLYYGALRGTPYKWLDIRRMCELLLKDHAVARVTYFTARISPRPDDQGQSVRQQTYLRALSTLPETRIVYGHFLTNEVYMPLAGCAPGKQQYVKAVKTEEKGSDVNLAAHLLWDAFREKARFGGACCVRVNSPRRSRINTGRSRSRRRGRTRRVRPSDPGASGGACGAHIGSTALCRLRRANLLDAAPMVSLAAPLLCNSKS